MKSNWEQMPHKLKRLAFRLRAQSNRSNIFVANRALSLALANATAISIWIDPEKKLIAVQPDPKGEFVPAQLTARPWILQIHAPGLHDRVADVLNLAHSRHTFPVVILDQQQRIHSRYDAKCHQALLSTK
jgi:hypothetical protein